MKEHYLRQQLLIGKEGQKKLQEARVGIVGCGALGSAVAHILARMGVGTLILFDGDTVAEHNLSRQHLYTFDDIGKEKAKVLAAHVQKINPEAQCIIHPHFIEHVDTLDKYGPYDLLIDGLDTHAARRLLDNYAQEKELWWVHGAAITTKGSVVAFQGTERTYSDVYPLTATDTHCADLGVFMTTTTFVANLQAQLALDILLGKKLSFELHRIDLETHSVTTYPIKKAL